MSRRPRRNRPPRLDERGRPADDRSASAPPAAPPSAGPAPAAGTATPLAPAPLTPAPLPPAPLTPAAFGAAPPDAGSAVRSGSIRSRLVAARVTGPHTRLGREEVARGVRRLATGDAGARLGLADLEPPTVDEAWKAVELGWGWRDDHPRAAIDPDRTLDGARDAFARVLEVAAGGARVVLATGRPASLLPVYRAVAAAVRAVGGTIVEIDRYGPVVTRRGAIDLWWHDGVAVAIDDLAIVGGDASDLGDEWCFATGRADLAVADHGFAGAALGHGVEVVALADLDAPVLGVAAARGLPIRLVPLDDRRPPAAYGALLELLALLAPVPVEA